MTRIIAISPSTSALKSLLHSLRKLLDVVISTDSACLEMGSELSARLQYDVGFSDLCPDRARPPDVRILPVKSAVN